MNTTANQLRTLASRLRTTSTAMTNAFTIPRQAFTEAERRVMRRQASGQRGGQTRRERDAGRMYITSNPTPTGQRLKPQDHKA